MIIFYLWLAWCGLLLLGWLCVPLIARGAPGPLTNGLQVFVPAGVRDRVSSAELEALIAHERGHIAHGHVFSNFMRACLFMPRCRLRQEHQADDYACQRVPPEVLASALRKLSFNKTDWQRAARIERLHCRPL